MSAPGITAELRAALPGTHSWAERPRADDLAGLPNTPAVYLLLSADQQPVQLATTQALRRLLSRRLIQSSRRGADLADVVRTVWWREIATTFEGRWWYYRLARTLYPDRYRRMISFGPAYFLHVDWHQRVPELRVSEQVWCLPGEFVGPWPTAHAAHAACQGLQDLFDLCRYPPEVRKAPHGTRCAYAEMHRCDAPCDGSVPLDGYVERCRAAWAFAAGAAAEWVATAEQRMRQAAEQQQYEFAAQIKRQLEFARQWQRDWGQLVRPAGEMVCLAALPVARRKAWKLVLFRQGELVDGPIVAARAAAEEAPRWFREGLASKPAELSGTIRMEQTWLFCHLMFSRKLGRTVTVWASADAADAVGRRLAAGKLPRPD